MLANRTPPDRTVIVTTDPSPVDALTWAAQVMRSPSPLSWAEVVAATGILHGFARDGR